MNRDQPKPKANDYPPVWDLVIADMKSRDQVGRKRYGVPLQPMNGRDTLIDAYEEALDLIVYLRSEIEEREINKNKASKVVNNYLYNAEFLKHSEAYNAIIAVRNLLISIGL